MNLKLKSIRTYIIMLLVVMFIGLGLYKVFAINYDLLDLAKAAADNSDTFWKNIKVGDKVNDNIPEKVDNVSATRWWLCLEHNTVSNLGKDNMIRSIVDIDVNVEKDKEGNVTGIGKYTAKIVEQKEQVSGDVLDDATIKKLAYLLYAASADPSNGYPESEGASDSKQHLYNFICNTNLKKYIGKYASKLSSTSTCYHKTIANYANKYSTTYSTGSNAEITSTSDNGAKVTVKNTNNATYSYIGPFKMKTSGEITEASIKDGNKNLTVAGYSYSAGGTIKTKIADIKTDGSTEFYIVTKSILTSLKPTVTIKTEGAAGGGTVTNPVTKKKVKGVVKGRIVFIGDNEGQATAIFRGSLITTKDTNDSVTFTAKNDLGKMTVTKVGAYAGDEEYETVRNVGFKVYHLDGTTKRYLRINNQDEIKNQAVVTISSSVSYTESEGNATTFYTYNGGNVSIDNISIEYKYYIEEVASNGTDYDIELIKATTQIGNGEITELPINNNIVGPITVELKGSTGSGAKVTLVTLTDYRRTGNLSIEKVDADTYDTKLGKVKFILRNTDTGKYVIARRTSEGEYAIDEQTEAYTENEDEATVFTTNSKTGKILVNDLDVGNYEIIETENPNYGYVVGSDDGENTITTTVEADSTQKEVIVNEKQTGNVQIRKIDADTGKPLENVSFVIRKRTSVLEDINGQGDVTEDGFIDMQDLSLVLRYVTGKVQLTKEQLEEADLNRDGIVNATDLRMLGDKVNSDYVVAMENQTTSAGTELKELDTVVGTKYLDGMKTTQNRDEATVFKTDVRGYIRLYNILEGDYIIDEVDVGDNNYGYEIDDNYISWDVDGKTVEGKSAIVTIERQRSYNTVRWAKIIEDSRKMLEDGMYNIQCLSMDRSITLNNESGEYGKYAAWDYSENNNREQEFYLQYLGNGQYYIISAKTGEYLSVIDVNGYDFIGFMEQSNRPQQRWYIEKQGSNYVIHSILNQGFALTGALNLFNVDIGYRDSALELERINGSNHRYQQFYFKSLTEQDTETTASVTARNKRKYIKLSGYVWEDISWDSGKIYDSNGLYQAINDDKNDKLVENITVRLKDRGGNTIPFKDANNNTVNETMTDANGKYTMVDVLIDNLDTYYIEFSYNGMAYESVEITYINNNRGTKAIEGDNVRERFNENFAQITNNENGTTNGYNGQSNDSNGEKANDIRYNQGSYSSTINYEGNYLYGYGDDKITEVQPYTGINVQDYKTYYPVNGVANKYIISSSTFEAYRSVGKSGFLSDIIDADSIRDNGTEEIGATFEDGINLGIKKRERPDLSVVKDLDMATVNLAGTQHVYLYGDRFNSELWADENGAKGHGLDPIVKFEEKYAQMTYSRPLYASDIFYDGNEKEKLSVKLTYKISVRNNSTTLNAQIYELDDYFDDKFNLTAVGTDIEDFGNIREGTEITNNTEVTQVSDEYKKVTIGSGNTPIAEMEPLTEKFIYLQFSVNREDIIDIIQMGDEYIKLDNIAEIKRYGITKTDENGEEKVYAGIDKDSRPGNTNPSDRSTFEDDTDKAPGLGVRFQKEREVNGKVFIDNDENPVNTDTNIEVHTGVARQGNGQYDDNEKGVENVKVTLREKNGDIAEVYNEETGEYEEAITYTDQNGEYTFGGFLPGEYYVQYSWGGNIDGEGINSTYTLDNGEEGIVNVQNYKSTIVDDEVWAAKGNTDKWYNNEFKVRYPGVEWNAEANTEIRTSDAIDDYDLRLAIDNETSDMTYREKQKFENTYTENSTGEKYTNTQMNSTTQGFTVYIEYTDVEDIRENLTDQNDEYVVDENNNKIEKEEFKTTINSIDFGIIERARQALELQKNIKSVKITLANGNVIVNAQLNENGELEDFAQYVTVIPDSPAANGQVNIQMDEELLQGATVEIEYKLGVINVSELDYQTEDFYNYGVGHGEVASEIVTLRPMLIIDYLNENTVLDTNRETTWDVVEKEDREDELIDSGLLSEDLKEVLLDTERIEVTDELQYDALIPDGIEIRNRSSNSNIGVNLKAYRLLSGTGEETFTENNAEIIRVLKDKGGSVLITTPGNYNPRDLSTSEIDDARSQSLVILPPTGLTTNYIAYILLAISSLGIVVAGVILIKKFVLK